MRFDCYSTSFHILGVQFQPVHLCIDSINLTEHMHCLVYKIKAKYRDVFLFTGIPLILLANSIVTSFLTTSATCLMATVLPFDFHSPLHTFPNPPSPTASKSVRSEYSIRASNSAVWRNIYHYSVKVALILTYLHSSKLLGSSQK